MLAFSLFDKKQAKYFPPNFAINRVTAMRAVAAMLKGERNNINEYPADFALYEIGRFDEDGGILISNTAPDFIEEICNLMPAAMQQKGGV